MSSKLKLGTFEDEHTENTNSASTKSQESTGDIDATGQVKTSEQYELVFLADLACYFFSCLPFFYGPFHVLPDFFNNISFFYLKRSFFLGINSKLLP